MITQALRKAVREFEAIREVFHIRHTSTDDSAYFGEFFTALTNALTPRGSELGLGMTLFSLVVSTRAEKAIEIGRFKGFSTLALASGFRLIDRGWKEPGEALQRPEVDYEKLHRPKPRKLYSIDPSPTRQAEERIIRNILSHYVEFINAKSGDVRHDVAADVLFIDGDHSYESCKRDVEMYVVSNLRKGGYFILHDYFGWFDDGGRNKSPIKAVCDGLISAGGNDQIVIDTNYPSFMVFRKL